MDLFGRLRGIWAALCLAGPLALVAPARACGEVIVLSGKVFDRDGAPATITEATFVGGIFRLQPVEAQIREGTFSFTLNVPNGTPLLFVCHGRAQLKELHWATISYLATTPDPNGRRDAAGRLLFEVNLVLFNAEGPFEVEAILNQMLTYERLYYINRILGHSTQQIRQALGRYVLMIPSPDGPRADVFNVLQFRLMGLTDAQIRTLRDTVRAKREELLRLYDLARGGVLVTDVQPGSSAERAGLEKGDVILRVNEATIETGADFRMTLRRDAGDTAQFLIRNVRTGRVESMPIDIEPSGKIGIKFKSLSEARSSDPVPFPAPP
jgi:membrane-associated protease RseP (regulator of RpoE activity)